MKRPLTFPAIAAPVLVLITCGFGGEPEPIGIVVASPTATPAVVTVIASPTSLPAELGGQPTPGAADTLPTSGLSAQSPPVDSLDPGDFWASFPLPQDAEAVSVVEGIDPATTTNMVEAQVFDFLAAWLLSQAGQQQAPTEAVVSLPHQRWRKGVSERLIETPGLDAEGRTEAWMQMTYLVTPAPPDAKGQARDVLLGETSPGPPVAPTPAVASATTTLAPAGALGWSGAATSAIPWARHWRKNTAKKPATRPLSKAP